MDYKMEMRFKLLLILLTLFSGLNCVYAQEREPLTLDQAISIAIENNPAISISNANVDISRAEVKNAKSIYYPQIKSRIIVPFIGRESGFFLDQLIWDFGRTSNLVKSTKALLKSTKFDKDTTEDDVILTTIISYYTVLSEGHIALALEKKVIESEKRIEQAEGFLKSGRVPQIEVTKAEVNLGNAKLERIAAQNNFEIAKVNLQTIMGIEDSSFNYELEDSIELSTSSYLLEESIIQALSSRPELKSLEAQKVAMRASLKASKKEFYPEIFGRTAYRFEGKGAQTPGFIAGVGVKFPIFEGFSRFAKVEDSKANLRRTNAELRSTKAGIISQIKQLYLDIQFSKENINVTKRTRKSAEQGLLLARERYKLARASAVELAEAESLYAISNAKYMQAIYNYNINVARLLRATGEMDESQKH
ncbi:MAG: TolC family protein [Thermodesulfobacteriota bacterium]